jgi:NhaA family Na+:H+ antiporter
VFYSSDLSASGFLVLGAGLAAIVGMRRLGVRNPWAYVPAGIVAWAGAFVAGIHPTLAGVVIGLMTPVLPERGPSGEERPAPVERIERALHGWVAFGAMPLFALANAGVSLGDAAFDGEPRLVLLGVVLGLVFGKPIGVVAFSWLAVRLRLATLPRGTTWSQVGLVGVVAGIGFTMSIFIAELAFPPGTNLETGKFGVLIASAVAGLLSYALGTVILRARSPIVGATTESLAEASTAD